MVPLSIGQTADWEPNRDTWVITQSEIWAFFFKISLNLNSWIFFYWIEESRFGPLTFYLAKPNTSPNKQKIHEAYFTKLQYFQTFCWDCKECICIPKYQSTDTTKRGIQSRVKLVLSNLICLEVCFVLFVSVFASLLNDFYEGSQCLLVQYPVASGSILQDKMISDVWNHKLHFIVDKIYLCNIFF